jgi:hypothetical protein
VGIWKGVAATTWLILGFALIVFGAGLTAMVTLTKDGVSAEGIVALVAAVLGVIGTHIGHVAGHALGATRVDAAITYSEEPQPPTT